MSRPFVVAVAGPHSSSGKTSLACEIIERLAARGPVGAMKFATATPDKICERSGLPCSCLMFEGKMRILEKDCLDDREGKDTRRLARAGASPVWFVQTTRDVALDSARAALARWDAAPTVVIEGAAPIRAGLADFAVLIGPAPGRAPKDGWLDGVADKIDAVLLVDDSATDALRAAGLRADAFTGPLGPPFWHLLTTQTS